MSNSGRSDSKSDREKNHPATVALFIFLILILTALVFQNAVTEPFGSVLASPEADPSPIASDSSAEPDVVEKTEFNPYSLDSTLPSRLISFTEVSVNGETVSDYAAKHEIDFGFGEDYSGVEGIVTFRGNNFRDGGSYGTADIADKAFSSDPWIVQTGSLQAPNGAVWTGSGWVGQPLIMTWPKEVRQQMNMYDWAKGLSSLTEVIYATMDGNVYFLDLESGNNTRPPLNLGYTFKGSGSLDPRGYPILYLGAGYDSKLGRSHAFIINLIDCSLMYEFGQNDNFSLRGTLSYFDGSPLVDEETDQLIYPGENGILYIIKLNTDYDAERGTLSIDPDNIVRWRYKGVRSTNEKFWLGMESSPVIWGGHLIMSDNGGNLMCLDLKTLELDWVQDVLDDTNCSPVLELEDGHPYIYISTSFHGGWRAPSSGTVAIPVWKIDAETGEVVWQTDYNCYTVDEVSGGTQGTIAVGKHKLSDLIFAPIARTPSASSGLLVALDKSSGEQVWSQETQMYAWSSPVAVYDKDGNGYLIFCTTGGYMYLMDGLTGEVFDHIDLGGNVEASPIVFKNKIVVGTRAEQIWGISIR